MFQPAYRSVLHNYARLVTVCWYFLLFNWLMNNCSTCILRSSIIRNLRKSMEINNKAIY